MKTNVLPLKIIWNRIFCRVWVRDPIYTFFTPIGMSNFPITILMENQLSLMELPSHLFHINLIQQISLLLQQYHTGLVSKTLRCSLIFGETSSSR